MFSLHLLNVLAKKKTEKYVKLHVMFSVKIAMFKVSEICSISGKSQGIFHSDVWRFFSLISSLSLSFKFAFYLLKLSIPYNLSP